MMINHCLVMCPLIFCHFTAHLANFNLTFLLFFSKCILQGWDMLTFDLAKCPRVVKKRRAAFAGAPLGRYLLCRLIILVWSQ